MSKRYQVTSLDVSADGMERLRSQSEWILIAGACGPDDSEAVLTAWHEDSFYLPESWDSVAAVEALDSWWHVDGGKEALQRELAAVQWDEWKPDGPDSDSGESIPCRVYIRESADVE